MDQHIYARGTVHTRTRTHSNVFGGQHKVREHVHTDTHTRTHICLIGYSSSTGNGTWVRQ